MSVKKIFGSLLVISMMATSAPAIAKSGSVDFKKEIEKLNSKVDGALAKNGKPVAGTINASEKQLLKKELAKIAELYEQYIADKVITEKEANILKIKLKKSDLNLFRKKYD